MFDAIPAAASAAATAPHLVALLGRWDEGDGPLYRRLAVALQRLLETGAVATGSVLPPERRMATVLSVSRTTVTAAYAELRLAGWVESRQGSGSVVTGVRHSPAGAHRANGLFATLLRSQPDLIDLTISAPHPAPIVTDVLTNPARHLDDPSALTAGHGYHPRGHPDLRAKLAEILSDNGLPTTDAELLITSGAQQAITIATAAIVNPGDPIGVEQVTFPGAIDALTTAGGRLHAFPVLSAPGAVDEVRRFVAEEHPRLLYVVPTFHNPTGGVLVGPERDRLARTIAESGTTTIDDLSLSELDFDLPAPTPLAALAPEAPILTVGSVSKLFWGGLRVGWIRAREQTIDHLTGVKLANDLGTSTPVQLSVAAMLDHYRDTRAWRNDQLLDSLDSLTGALTSHLPALDWERPLGGPHLWVRLPDTDATSFVQLAIRHGVAAVAGPLLAVAGGSGGSDRIRLPYYAPSDVLEAAVVRLAAAWRARPAT